MTSATRGRCEKTNDGVKVAEMSMKKDHEGARRCPTGDYLVSCVNEDYMELVGSGNESRGRVTFMSLFFIFGLCLIMTFLAVIFFSETNTFLTVLTGGLFLLCLPFLWLLVFVLRVDSFRLTQYPVRISRSNRNVYVFKQNGELMSSSWENVEPSHTTLSGRDRALSGPMGCLWVNFLDEKTSSVVDKVPIVSDSLSRRELLESNWEFIRRYVEDDDGVEKSVEDLRFCVPGSTQREGLWFGVIHAFFFCPGPLLKFVFSPVIATMVIGRWFSIYTSKLPKWPDEIIAECEGSEKGGKELNWNNYGAVPFWEGTWPVFCFVIGICVDIAGVWYLLRSVTS